MNYLWEQSACWGSHHMGGNLTTTGNPHSARRSPLGRSLACLLSRGKEGGVEDGHLWSNCIFVSAILCCCLKASAAFAQVSCYAITKDIFFDTASICKSLMQFSSLCRLLISSGVSGPWFRRSSLPLTLTSWGRSIKYLTAPSRFELRNPTFGNKMWSIQCVWDFEVNLSS